jgi:hypothetical protein
MLICSVFLEKERGKCEYIPDRKSDKRSWHEIFGYLSWDRRDSQSLSEIVTIFFFFFFAESDLEEVYYRSKWCYDMTFYEGVTRYIFEDIPGYESPIYEEIDSLDDEEEHIEHREEKSDESSWSSKKKSQDYESGKAWCDDTSLLHEGISISHEEIDTDPWQEASEYSYLILIFLYAIDSWYIPHRWYSVRNLERYIATLTPMIGSICSVYEIETRDAHDNTEHDCAEIDVENRDIDISPHKKIEKKYQ